MTTFICIRRSAADGSPIDPDIYEIDTDAQAAEAKRAMRDAGIESAEVWSGEPEEGESVKTSLVLHAAEVETETSDAAAAAEYNDIATAQKHGREAFRQTVEMAESDDDIDLNDPMEVASLTAYGWCESEYDAQREDAVEAYRGFLGDGAEPTAEAAEAFVRGFGKARDARLAEMGEEDASDDEDAIRAGKDGLDEDEASELCEQCLIDAGEAYASAYRKAWMEVYRDNLDDEDSDDEDSDDEDSDDEDSDDEDSDDEDSDDEG